MEFGEKIKELNMTVDEIDRFTKAFKDEKFRGMLIDYTRELSDPENKKKYEAEIKQLELERGHYIEFIYPQPVKVLRTSLDGKQKCFINICSNEKIGKPEFKWKISEDGRRGQHWSIPHILAPGRQDRDQKGNKFMIYDAIFHPDTIHIASKNKRYMDMVDNTAVQAIQDGFKVKLDKNMRELTIKYKGSPNTCVIRKPIPGYTPREPLAQPDPLAFPYPDEKKLSTATTEPAEATKTKDSGDVKPKTFQIEVPKPQEPTIPNYTVKYRSFIDLQDFRCSRDSAQSPRPKEIVVTVDVPLLKSVRDTNLEVREKSLLLESQKPAYRLEVTLAYPVDEDKGEAKFHKQKGQLIITLPVLPSKETLSFAEGPTPTISDHEREQEGVGGVEEEKLNGQKNKGGESEEEERRNGEKENEKSTESEDHEWRCDKATQTENFCETLFQGGTATQTDDSSATAFKRDTVSEDVHHTGLSAEEDKSEDVHHTGLSAEEDKSEDVHHTGLSAEEDKSEDVHHTGLYTEEDKSEDVHHTGLSTEEDKSEDVHHTGLSAEEDKSEDVRHTGLSTEEDKSEDVHHTGLSTEEDKSEDVHHTGLSAEEDKSEDVRHTGLSAEEDKLEDVHHTGLSTEEDKSEDVHHTGLSAEEDKSEDVRHTGLSAEEDKLEDVHHTGLSTEEDNSEAVDNGNMTSPNTENQPMSSLKNNEELAEQFRGIGEERGASPDHSDELRAQVETSEVSEEIGKSAEDEDHSNGNLNKMETDPLLLNQKSNESSPTAADLSSDPDHNNNLTKDCSMSQGMEEIQEMSTPDKAKKSRKRNARKKRVNFIEEVAMDPVKVEESEEIDDDLQMTEQTFPDRDSKLPPVLLREVNGDGTETVIRDHSTSAGFTFQNSLMYELD